MVANNPSNLEFSQVKVTQHTIKEHSKSNQKDVGVEYFLPREHSSEVRETTANLGPPDRKT